MSKQTLFTFPDELKNTISALKNEKQWSILEALITFNNELSYTRLREEIGLESSEKGDLNYHLKELEKGGWLRNVVKAGSDIADRYSSYYSISKFGLKIIEGAMKSLDRRSYLQDPYDEIKAMINPAFESDMVIYYPKKGLPKIHVTTTNSSQPYNHPVITSYVPASEGVSINLSDWYESSNPTLGIKKSLSGQQKIRIGEK